ncbi:MAG TPA: response regulator [Segeticoccus sp.]|uniref:response regulator n=1 Tax=Segeticoccus sp. TaxID=2706531 RepID=UPI002D7F2BAD|nr:response regulator [Segeticoccus sp.]HET8598753.1 response regulator [Segeticoccus sp.]
MSIRTLVVDDDFLVVRVHRRMVERVPGFEVVGVAATGEEAVAVAADTQPDLVLLDMHLPDVFGHDVIVRMRERGVTADVLAISAARESDTVHGAARLGVVGYLLKPFTFEDLHERLQRYAEDRVARAEQGTHYVSQGEVDAVFRPSSGPAVSATTVDLPKGLSEQTLGLVRSALADRSGDEDPSLSATECAEAVGISRVSARRYLEYLCEVGAAVMRLKYGGAGRPERRYALASDVSAAGSGRRRPPRRL